MKKPEEMSSRNFLSTLRKKLKKMSSRPPGVVKPEDGREKPSVE